MSYPDTQSFAHSFTRSELTVSVVGGGTKIFDKIDSVSGDQPTEEQAILGTSPYPYETTPGAMEPGEGTIHFTSEEQRMEFLELLGDAWRERRFTLTWVHTAPGKRTLKKVYRGCRCLSEPDDDSRDEPLGGDVNFSFLSFTKNGLSPHSGALAPTR
jgi:hypothetical protein